MISDNEVKLEIARYYRPILYSIEQSSDISTRTFKNWICFIKRMAIVLVSLVS